MTTPNHEIPVVILAGGMGTRFREQTELLPKPLIPIGDRPVLWHIMKTYSHYGFRRFILCLGYKGWDIKMYFLQYREHLADFTVRLSDDHEPVFHNRAGDEEWEVTCVETGLTTGTGGRLWRVQDYIDSDTFMFTYGDGVGRVDLDKLLACHRANGLAATVTGVHPTSRFGEMRVDGDRVVEFNEKPTIADGFVSGGYFALQRSVFDYMSDDAGLLWELDPMQKIARDGQLGVYQHDDYWLGMDTYRDWQELEQLWATGAAPWKVWS